MEFGSGIQAAESPVNARLNIISLLFQGVDLPAGDSSSGRRCLRHLQEKMLNSISAIFSHLPCLGG